jgi:hypothetical protein
MISMHRDGTRGRREGMQVEEIRGGGDKHAEGGNKREKGRHVGTRTRWRREGMQRKEIS